MKNLIFLLTFIAILFSCNSSQISETTHVVAISPVKLNVLYVGIENPLTIAVSGIPSSQLRVAINQGTIEGTAGNYIATINEHVEMVSIVVKAEIEAGTIKDLGTMDFRVELIPAPVARLDGKYLSGKVPVSKFKEASMLTANLTDDYPFEVPFEVLRFEMMYARKNIDLIKIVNTGAEINEKGLALIRDCKEGDIVFFQAIEIKGPDDVEQKIAHLSFELY